MTQVYIERYWRDATPADAIREPPMVARFCNEYCPDWVIGKLIYWDRSETPWHREDGFCYDLCQVYDAPDPGEGWRLIDIDKDAKQEGDEFLSFDKAWKPAHSDKFFSNHIYRRRITPIVTYIPFTWEDREQLRGRIITFVGRNRTVEFRCESFSVDDDEFLVNDFCAKWLCKNAVFVDTKEPVGKKVTQ